MERGGSDSYYSFQCYLLKLLCGGEQVCFYINSSTSSCPEGSSDDLRCVSLDSGDCSYHGATPASAVASPSWDVLC